MKARAYIAIQLIHSYVPRYVHRSYLKFSLPFRILYYSVPFREIYPTPYSTVFDGKIFLRMDFIEKFDMRKKYLWMKH